MATPQELYDQVFIEAFGITSDQLGVSLTFESIPGWDSVGHMELVAGLESAFDIMLDTDDIIDLDSYEKGKELLRKYDVEL